MIEEGFGTRAKNRFDLDNIQQEEYFSENTREKLADFKMKYGKLNGSVAEDTASKASCYKN